MKNIYNILFRISLIAAFVLAGASAYAQSYKVSGTVKDAKGEAVIGAVVMLEGNSSVGTVTDVNGAYTLTIPSDAKNPKLNVSCMSYATISEDVAKRAVINFTLNDDNVELDEAIVVGYGAMRKSDLTGSVASVKITESDAAQSTSIDELLQGKAAGVQVINTSAQPDAGVSIRVRGMQSFNGSNEPLYVVDGVILNVNTTETLLTQGSGASSDQQMNGLMGINPQDIASMEILKDASATAIYGSQGANGVVLITTKSANRDKPVINFTAGVDVCTRYKKIDVLGFDEFVDYYQIMGGNMSSLYEDPIGRQGLKVEPVDWQDYVDQVAVNQRYYVSVSGRPKSLNYMFSAGYNKKNGVVKGSSLDQFTIRLNLDKTFGKHFAIGTKTGIAYINSEMTQGADGSKMNASSSLMRSIIQTRPFKYPATYVDGEEEQDEANKCSADRWLEGYKDTREEFRITPSAYIKYTIIPELNLRLAAGADYRSYERNKWKDAKINSSAEGNTGAVGNYEVLNYNIDLTLNFNKKWGSHRLSGTAGLTYRDFYSRSQVVEGWGITQYIPRIESVNGAPNTRYQDAESQSAIASALVRAIYNFKERYVLTATYRLDGSSRFQGANKWSSFPSFAFAWRINQEPWFNAPVISNTKLRVGWGMVGNQSVGNYQTLSTYGNARYGDNTITNLAQSVVALYPTNMANPDLKWETTQQVNAGIDFAMWQGRLTISADAYYKRTYDLLQSKKIPLSAGAQTGTMWVNDGSISNRGLEFTVDATPIKTRDFEWGINGNISFNRNRIEDVGSDAEVRDIYLTTDHTTQCRFFYGDKLAGTAPTYPGNIFIEGQPMGLFYGYMTDGIIQKGETGPNIGNASAPRTEGQVRFVDLNGNGYIDDDDRTIIGNPNPKFTYGFSTSFSWKGLTLSANFVGSYGNDLINVSNILDKYPRSSLYNILSDSYHNAWSETNQSGTASKLEPVNLNDIYCINNTTIEDGSYLRLAKVSLAYEIPMPKKCFLKGLNVALSGGNLVCWTTYSGYDPDVNSFGTNVKKMGVDVGSYPSARSYSFDIKFRF